MIRLHRLNGQELVVNAELIEAVDGQGAQTAIIMATNNRIIVRESAAEVIEKACEYRRTVGLSYVPRPLRAQPETGGTQGG